MAFKPIQIIIGAKDEASAVFNRLQTKIAAVGAVIAGYFGVKAFVGAVQSAADFEAAMSRVEAATGASGQELKALEKAAADAGANTQFTASQAANALENLAKAGLDGAQSIQALNPVLNLAAAADVDLATAAEFVTKAVMGMGLQFEDAGRVADVLALGANATNTSVSGLAQALSYAAPVAQSVGLTLEETTAIMGKLADAGIDASRAGTGMANILAQFSDPASKFKKELAAIGITTNDFNEALRQLEAAGDKGKAAILAVGLNAGPALQSLLNQGMGSVDALADKLRNASGSAAEAAKVMQDNLQGSMKGLGSAWEAVQNALMTPVLPVLTSGINQLADAFRASVSDGTIGRFGQIIKTAFENGIEGVKTFIATFDAEAIIAKFQAWATSAGDTFGKIAEYAQTAGGVVQVVWGAMSTGANTVMAIIYKVAEAFAGVASNVQSGIALILDGLAKVTFGGLSASFKAAADEVRISAGATGAVAQAFADQAGAAFDRAADGADTLRAGFGALAADSAAPAESIKTVAVTADELAQSATNAASAQDKQAQAAIKSKEAAQASAAAVAALRGEYTALIEKGDLDAAALKMQEINQRLRETGGASDAAKAGIASVGDAFALLGITSSAALKNTADQSRAAYEVIRDSGTASARDVREAFRVAAQAAIDAADGIAPSWVRAEAGLRGFTVEVDKSGKHVLRLAEEIRNASAETGNLKTAWHGVGQAIESAADKAARVKKETAAAAEAAEAADRERRRQDGYAVDTKRQTYDQAKSSGLSEAQALAVADEFWNNGKKSGWGGARLGDTWGSLVAKRIDEIVLANARKNAAAENTSPTPSAQPVPGVAASTAPASTTYVSNITLPGGGTQQLRFTDAASQSTAEQLLRELARAKGAAA